METLKIMLVDDDPFYLNLFHQYVLDLGHEHITTFDNGQDCLNALHTNPDIIFLDHNMDNLTGYEVLNKIKRYNPSIFVVMVSAQEEIKVAVDSLKHGAFDYLKKGDNEKFSINRIILKIQEVKTLMQIKNPSLFTKVVRTFMF